MHELRAQLEETSSTSNGHADRAQDLEASLKTCQAELVGANQTANEAVAKAATDKHAAEEAKAETRVLSASLTAAHEELTARKMQYQAMQANTRALQDKLKAAQVALTQANARVCVAEEALGAQKGVNEVLMRRKEEVEWNLMTLLAHVGQMPVHRGPYNPCKSVAFEPFICPMMTKWLQYCISTEKAILNLLAFRVGWFFPEGTGRAYPGGALS